MVDRYSIQVRGIVQGVGFRPFVHGLASRLGLGGSVKNLSDHVLIEIQGEGHALGNFLRRLSVEAPPSARIDEIQCEARPLQLSGVQPFVIETSAEGSRDTISFPSDMATCRDCLAELFDPGDRRYRHPFINCTNCGPRWTIIKTSPYDRANTTMAQFPICPRCRSEYEDPRSRRFHAQPICCLECGPRLRWVGHSIGSGDSLGDAITSLVDGKIGAIKGIGGYHLACNARSEMAVAELRLRKRRDEKPLAILVADLSAAEGLCEVSRDEAALLASPRGPIVLLRKHRGVDLSEGVAAGGPTVGVMLPYTPLHHLLIRGMNGDPLVLTSGNVADEPIAFEDHDVRRRLAGLADFQLTHDRPILIRCDDSVTRVAAGGELPLRRSRGSVPESLTLPRTCPVPTLAVGGQQKSTFGLGRGRRAILSHYLGDLDDFSSYCSFEEAVRHFEGLFGVAPERMVTDLHPDYPSTLYADRRGGEILRVQHHHAHIAGCMAENRLDEPVIGVALDGTGLGTDGAIWGGEFLSATYEGFRRLAHFRYVRMPGGSAAIREPWRMALAYLEDSGEPLDLLGDRVTRSELNAVGAMLDRGFNSPFTSSAGRLFDAVAALAGLRSRVRHEGQAAMELEWRSAGFPPDSIYPFGLAASIEGGPLTIDTRPLISAVASDLRKGVEPGRVGRRFHSSMVEIIAEVCGRIRSSEGLNSVVLSGGVFMNVLLLEGTVDRLDRDGFAVYRHRLVPPNDGGLCLGQLAISAATSTRPSPSAYVAEAGGCDVPGNPR